MQNNIKTKKIKKFNVLDVVVILLVILLIATFIYRIYVGVDKVSNQENSKYVMTFECDSEYNSLLDYLQSGEAVYLEYDGVFLGRLYADDESTKEAVYEIIDESANAGTGSSTSIEYRKIKIGGQLKLNVDAVKVKNGSYYVIGDTNITKGSVLNVYTDKAEFTITVIDISHVK